MAGTNPAPLDEIRESPFWGAIDRLALLAVGRHSREMVQTLVKVVDFLLRVGAVVGLCQAASVFSDPRLDPGDVIDIVVLLGVAGFAPRGEGLTSSVAGAAGLVVLWASRGKGQPTAEEILYAAFAFGLLLTSGAARWLWGTTLGAPRSTLRAYLLWALGAFGVILAVNAAAGLTLSGALGASARSAGVSASDDPAHLGVLVQGDGASLIWTAVVLAVLLMVVPWFPLPWRRRTLGEGQDQPCATTELIATGLVWALVVGNVGADRGYPLTAAVGGAVFGGVLWWLVSFVAPERARPRLVVHGCASLAVLLFACGVDGIVEGSAVACVIAWAMASVAAWPAFRVARAGAPFTL